MHVPFGRRDRRGACARGPITVLSVLPDVRATCNREQERRHDHVDTRRPGPVTGGVDTHKRIHVAAVIDSVGRLLATAEFATTSRGYRQLLAWMRGHGELVAVGVEGCGSWGAGLARHLTAAGVRVVEVNRPNRQNRRRRGKSDVIDAEAAARAVLAGNARVTPKTQTGPVEAVHQLRVRELAR